MVEPRGVPDVVGGGRFADRVHAELGGPDVWMPRVRQRARPLPPSKHTDGANAEVRGKNRANRRAAGAVVADGKLLERHADLGGDSSKDRRRLGRRSIPLIRIEFDDNTAVERRAQIVLVLGPEKSVQFFLIKNSGPPDNRTHSWGERRGPDPR